MSLPIRMRLKKSNKPAINMRKVEEILNDYPALLEEIAELEMIYAMTEPPEGASVVKFNWDKINGDPTQFWGLKRAEIKTQLDACKRQKYVILSAKRKMKPQERRVFDLYFHGRLSRELTMRAMGIKQGQFMALKSGVVTKVAEKWQDLGVKHYKT